MASGPRNAEAAVGRQLVATPVYRTLRVFAVDPGLTARFETAVMNEMTIRIPWEPLEPGPVGDCVEVVDVDEEGKQVHAPVDLDSVDVLAHHGLAPSDGNPQFRQQMLYAVAMRTIRNFERALGRRVQWPAVAERSGGRVKHSFRRRLRLSPHYMREANAYYSEDTGLVFGYFESGPDTAFPGTLVFTCLSQDVIAHELTHPLLQGMGVDFELGTNPDVPAFHEAFADLVALFQHFGQSEVLRAQIAAVRGSLDERSALGAVALQFGQALGRPDGIRNAFGATNEEGKWVPRRPDPKLYRSTEEPHARGDLLMAAVFDAFRKIYESRVADLRRLATKGTGILPVGELQPDLVDRLTREAAVSARHVLHMCIRALDYLPPVELTFGDYLRAILTADYDVAPADERRYRVAFADAFRAYGLLPAGLGTLSVDTLLWPRAGARDQAAIVSDFVRDLSAKHTQWNLPPTREELWNLLEGWKRDLAAHLRERGKTSPRLGVIDLTKRFTVHAFQLRGSTGPADEVALRWVIKITQGPRDRLAGCTLVVDAETARVLYRIERKTARGDAEIRPDPLRTTGGTRSAPTARSLRVFAFDPSLGFQLETAGINEVTLEVPWERDGRGRDLLEPGPVGEYVEVVDHDPASRAFYAPVDLNDPLIIAQDGLTPSESNPQFHQQMVYAVTMRTIRHFERAHGRLALWSPRRRILPSGRRTEEYVQRLRIHPHALREANAYYSPAKKALLFGYFPAPGLEDGAGAARLTIFTCLSHDIVAHEVTHALLDGIHRRFNEPSNPDVLAFHEAFADIVALFLHFALPEALRHQIAITRGDLASQNRLGELARQFGQAIGKRGALRSAIGVADPEAYHRELEPHARGAILVAAVFDAFLTIYKARVADLLRIASEGTGVLPQGELHPDLVNRLADEAAATAERVLHMSIRALDYCPPVDITFGDYLRAVVTADFEFDPVDAEHRRVAFVEAFRRHGIVPEDVRTLSVDGLLWRPTWAAPDEDQEVVIDLVRHWATDIGSWSVSSSREELYHLMRKRRAALHEFLAHKLDAKRRKPGEAAVLSGIDPERPFEVHSIRPSVRSDWSGQARFQWIVELTQRVPQWADEAAEKRGDPPDYYFRGGCTLLLDAETAEVRYSIKKPLDEARRERQRRYLLEEGNESLAATYFGGVADEEQEPFAVLHRF